MSRNKIHLLAMSVLMFAGCARDTQDTSRAPAPTTPETTPTQPAPAGTEQARGVEPVKERPKNLSEALESMARAKVALQSAEGRDVEGTLYLLQEEDSVLITGAVRGLEPGQYAIHIHDRGDCSAPDFVSAGEHFNPTGATHAAPFTETKHAGDLGNLTTNAKGVADVRVRADNTTLESDARGILNRAIVIHEKADDFRTQPDGAAGKRIACGVIKPMVQPES